MDDVQDKSTFLEPHRRKVLGGIIGAAGIGTAAAGVQYWSSSSTSDDDIETEFFVSLDGDDEWSGADPDPPSGGGDNGPFETPERARDAIRELKAEDGLSDDGVVVSFRGGTYRYDESPFELTEEDSGKDGAPVIYQAYEDESVRFIGGIELDTGDFEPVSDDAVLERIPEGARGDVVQFDLETAGITDYGEIVTTGFNLPRAPPNLELFVDSEAMELARWPNEGWTLTGSVSNPGGRPRDIQEKFTERPLPDEFDEGATFEYTEPRPLFWDDYEDIWMDGYWWNDYAMSNLKIADVDTQAETITTEQAHHYSIREGQRYYYYNVLDELDVPGEFYIDRDTGMLYLYSPVPVEEATIELSLSADPIVVMDGVSNLEFQGVDFELCRGSGVQLIGCSNCLIEGATIRRIGVMGVLVGDNPSETITGNDGGTNNGVDNCEIYGTGLGGVKLGGGNRETLDPGENYVTNCDIHDFSRNQSTYTPAVWPTGVGNLVAHNHMHHAPHQAVLIGGNEHVIEYNDIHHVVAETSDAGAIYMGRDWSEQANVIRNNYIHHIDNPSDLYGIGQVGVYLDDLASGTVIEGNVLYKNHQGFFIGGGRDNEIRNNLFVECRRSIVADDRGMDESWPHCRSEDEGGSGVMPNRLQAMPYTEEPWSEEYPHLVGLLEAEVDDRCAPADNTISCNVTVDSAALEFDDPVLEHGTVENNLELPFSPKIKEPKFVDAESQNFAFEDGSPVLETLECFENLPFGEIEFEEKSADYAVSEADIYVEQVEDGAHDITVTVHNTGRAEASETTVRVEDVTGGTEVGEVTTDSISPTASVDVTFEWETSEFSDGDERELRATVVPDEPDQSNSNNSATALVTLPAPPLELEIFPVYGTVIDTETVRLTVPVTNVGTVDSPETTVQLIDVTDGETVIEDLTLSSLEPGERMQLEYDWNISGFDADQLRSVEATIDPAGDLEQRTNEADMTPTTEIDVLAPLPENYEAYGSTSAEFGTVDESGNLAIRANGADIWKADDAYGALYDPNVSADRRTIATVKVVSQGEQDGWAKAGLMLRNDVTQAGESLGYAALMVTPSNNFEFEWDQIGEGTMNKAVNAGETTYPCWLRFERDGASVIASYSTDGEEWIEIGVGSPFGGDAEQDIAMFSTSHTTSSQSLAEFAEFDVTTRE